MENFEITNRLFREAVEAIDAGNIGALKTLITYHPELVRDRLVYPPEGYFQHPYLLWFVADNPIRVDKLPPNIVSVTSLLVEAVKRQAPESFKKQIDYTLGLVATGRIPRECGVQIEMIDLLIDAGATPGGGLGALAHGNIEAANHLIDRGGKLTMAAAVGLERINDIKRLAPIASPAEQLVALTTAAFYGKANLISMLLGMGINPNGYPKNGDGFHSHATPLHQAVCSGSLESVKLLVEAGADKDAKDKIYHGTPLGWAEYMQSDKDTEENKRKEFAVIAGYLKNKQQSK